MLTDDGARHGLTRALAPGLVGFLAGLTGVAIGLLMIVYPAAVAEDNYSHPFGEPLFAVIQAALAVRDIGLAVLLLALWPSGAIGRSMLGRIGVVGSVVAMLVLAVMEVVSIVDKDGSSVGAGYGLASLAIAIFCILAGVATLRAGVWTGRGRLLPLALGVYVFVPMTPGILAGFVVEQLVIAGWMVLFALLGLLVMRGQERAG